MLLRVKTVSSAALLATLTCCCLTISAAAPYQELAPRAGHVPVYIREGDTPLAEINPKLAEAFHEMASGNLMLEDSGIAPDVVIVTADKEDGALVMLNDDTVKEAAEPQEVVGDIEDVKKSEELKDQIAQETKEENTKEDVKSVEDKPEEDIMDEVKTAEVKSEEVKTEEVKSEEVKTEEVKSEDVKSEEGKTEDKTQEEEIKLPEVEESAVVKESDIASFEVVKMDQEEALHEDVEEDKE